jgi:long-subunit fatty acid transport protein
VALGLWLLLPSAAWAGGFEFPDNDTEALGRGAAFTAKADDAMALQYNVAGLARQRGTRVLLGANLSFHSYTFQRSGAYPGDPTDPLTVYAGLPYPKVSNSGGVFFAPLFGITTDFDKLDRWTFGFGVWGPSSVGNRTWGLKTGNLPAPSRYDLVSESLIIALPTLAAAVRVTKWLDLGVALHLVVGSFELENASVVPLGANLCPFNDFAPCDAPTKINTSGVTATASIGAMFHPRRDIDLGLDLRGPADIDSSGTISTPELFIGTTDTPEHLAKSSGNAQVHTHLPWVLRLGGRYRFLRGGFEAGDVELDVVYEAWAAAEGDGDTVHIDDLSMGLVHDVTVKIQHNYRDTASVRLGGAYNQRLSVGVLTFRAGGFFDSAATHYKDTRLDIDTMAKWAGTVGVGYRARGVAINVAYAYIWSPDRNVQNGTLQQLNGLDGTNTVQGDPLPVVNNGLYKAHTQVFSISLGVAWEELLKKQRVLRYE